MKRNILLVHPPQRGLLDGFSNGLFDLANFVAAREPDVEIALVDLGLTPTRDLAAAARAALARVGVPVVVGITTTTASYRASLETARAFKAAAPDALIVLGGHHASPQHDVILAHHASIVDVVIRGEGERALLALARGDRPEQVPGCSSRKRGLFRANPPAPLLSQSELDTLPATFGKITQSAPGKFEHATYVSARGCPLRCAFCAVAGDAIRAKSIGRIVADLRYLVGEIGYQKIAIEDNFFAQNRSRTHELCAAIAGLQGELETPFGWDCQTRVESMQSPEIRAAFARSGCEAVYLGVESLIERELEYLGKTARPARYVEMTFGVCAALLTQPYDCYVNIQVGLPAESERQRALRVERLTELGRLATARGRSITIFPQLNVVYPGTQHFWKALEQGTFGRHGAAIFEVFSEWEAAEEPVLRFLGENFAHGVGGIPLGILDGERLRLHGELVVRDDEVIRLKEHLDRLGHVDGLTLFKYGAHLATDARPRADTHPLLESLQ